MRRYNSVVYLTTCEFVMFHELPRLSAFIMQMLLHTKKDLYTIFIIRIYELMSVIRSETQPQFKCSTILQNSDHEI